MKTLNKFSFFIALIIHGLLYSQDISEIIIEPSENNFLLSQNFDESFIRSINEDNSVFINQVGLDNQINVKIESISSTINLFQNGDNNNILLDVKSDRIEALVIQDGDNNRFLDFSSFGNEFHSAEVIQQGNDQNLTWFGGNSISEKIKINMLGDSKTIIVRNFN